MTNGLSRRPEARDNLASQAGIEPVSLRGTGVMNPRPMSMQSAQASEAAKIAQSLAAWGGGHLADAVKKQQQDSVLEGRMAYHQGQSMDDVEMGGDPWALEGYRQMDAQSTASSLLAAQREMIAQADHMMTPDEYRASLMDRVNGMLDGMDPRTRELAETMISEQLPVLANDHTVAHIRYAEQESFNSLERTVDIVSRDPTATAQLVAFAEGAEGSPSAGLTPERRKAAVVSGVIRAFDNDNPMAFSALAAAGHLGDTLTTEQQQAIRGAQQRFEQRRRSEYNEALFQGERALLDSVEQGDMDPAKAVEELSTLYADHGIEMTRAEAGAIYGDAEAAQRTERKTASVLIEDAQMRGDHATVARLSERVLYDVGVQAGGPLAGLQILTDRTEGAANYDTLYGHSQRSGSRFSGVRVSRMTLGQLSEFSRGSYAEWSRGEVGRTATPMGRYQIVGATMRRVQQAMGLPDDTVFTSEVQDQMFGFLVNEALSGKTTPGAKRAALRSVWEGYKHVSDRELDAAVEQYEAGGSPMASSDNWRATVEGYGGNVVHAALAVEFGSERTDAFLQGADDPSLTAHAERVQSQLDNWRAPTPQDRLQLAGNQLDRTRKMLAMDNYAEYAPRVAELDDQFMRGEIEQDEWISGRRTLYQAHQQERDQALVNEEVQIVRQFNDALDQRIKEQADTATALTLERAHAQLEVPRVEWEAALADENATPESIQRATQAYLSDRDHVFQQYGIQPQDQGIGQIATEVAQRTAAAIDRYQDRQADQVLIDRAVAHGYLDTLPPALRSRAFDQAEDQIIQRFSNEVAEQRMTPEQAQAQSAQALNAFFATAGMVDPKVSRHMSGVLRGPLVDSQGNPNPNVVDALQQFAQIRAMNPHAADSFFDKEGLVLANAVMSRAENPALIPEAVRNLGIEMQNAPHVQDTREFLARPDVQERVDRAVTSMLEREDIGLLHAIWQGDAFMDQRNDRSVLSQDRIWSEEMRTNVKAEVVEEVTRLQRTHPNIGPSDLVQQATQNVTNRTAIVGGSLVVGRPGQNLATAFFGTRAGEMMHDGAINSAVMEYLRSPEVQEQYPRISNWEVAEVLPGFVQDTLDGVAGVFGGEFDPAVSGEDFQNTWRTGVRPFEAFMGANGQLYVEVLLPDGNGSVIPIDMKRAGDLYTQRRRQDVLDQ